MTDKNEFARANLGLVHACCKRYSDRGADYDELFAAGCLGLAKAINNFDESRGLRFSTYAFPVITGEIKRLFRDGGAVKVSRTLRELALKATRLSFQIKAENGREPTVAELARILDVSEEKVIDALNSSRLPLSLTAEYGDENNPPLEIPVDDIQEKITERLSLEQAVNSLDDADKKIIDLRYCLGKTQTQTAKLMSMSQVQVSRREKKILAAIREKMSG